MNGNYQKGGYNGAPKRDKTDPIAEYRSYGFKKDWIISGIDKDFVVFAEKVGNYMAKNGLTTSKIRNIYSEIKRIQMDFEREKAAFYLLKPKVAYTVGRDKNIDGLKMFKFVFDDCFDCVTENRHYINFCNIMEAIVAYHKAYGGRDN